MKTVGDFKKAGLVFDGEDILISSVDQVEFPVKYAIMGSVQESVVKSFSWRTNTGVKPEFDGLVEAKAYNGDITVDSATGESWANDGEEYDIKEWRPHLPPEATKSPHDAADASKPAYTKEMHEAGELPPVGSEFAVDVEAEPRDYHIELTCVAHHKDGGAIGESSSKYLHNVTEGFKPIKTEREKLIDEITGEFHMADQATIGLMFDLGYRKEQVK